MTDPPTFLSNITFIIDVRDVGKKKVGGIRWIGHIFRRRIVEKGHGRVFVESVWPRRVFVYRWKATKRNETRNDVRLIYGEMNYVDLKRKAQNREVTIFDEVLKNNMCLYKITIMVIIVCVLNV